MIFAPQAECDGVEDVDVILGRQQGADIPFQHKIQAVGALDGFGNVWVGGVNESANLAAGRA